jgi:glycosyltransferase involved in cell wall biosynthesis
MRILHVIPMLDPRAGGPPAVVLRIAAGQASLGHTVYLAHPPVAADREADTLKSYQSIPGIAGVQFVPFDPGFSNILGRLLRDPPFPEVDVAHIHGGWEPCLQGAARWARKRGIPYCFVPHGMLDVWSLQQKRWKKRAALTLGWKSVFNGSAFIHVLNSDEGIGLKPVGLTPPTVTIPNGIFMREIEPLPEHGRFRAAHPELGADPYILFLSRLHYKKGLDYLADAFKAVAAVRPDARLVVAGPDDGERAAFEQRIASHGLSARTHVIGPIYGRAKYEAMTDAACFCLPSRQEGFSVAITEALALSCPVVITRECHFPEVGEVGAGFVTGLDAEEVGRAILTLLGDAEAARAMGRRGQALVRERFTWERIAEQTIEAYRQHCGVS